MGGFSNLLRMPGKIASLTGEVKSLKRELKAVRKENKQIKQLLQSNLLTVQSLGVAMAKRDDETVFDTRKRIMANVPPAALSTRMFQLAGLVLLNVLDDACRENDIEYWLDFGALLGAIRHGKCIPWDDDIDVCMTRGEFNKLRKVFEGNEEFFVCELYSHTPTNSMNHVCQLKYLPTETQADLPCCLDIFIFDYVENADDLRATTKRIRDLRQEHRDAAWELFRKLTDETGADEFSDTIQGALKDFFEERLVQARSELNLGDDSGEGLVWAMDNYRLSKLTKYTHCRVDEVFPLVEIELEGRKYYSPKTYEARLQQQFDDYYAFPSNSAGHKHFSATDDVLYDVAKTIDRFADRYLQQIDEGEIDLACSWL